MKSIKTYRNFNDNSEFLGLSIWDLLLSAAVFLLSLALLRDTNLSILAIVIGISFMGVLVPIRKGRRTKIIRDSFVKFIGGRKVYDPRSDKVS